MRLILGVAALLEGMWIMGTDRRVWQEIRSFVQVQQIEEKGKGGNGASDWAEDGEGAILREGVKILLDEKSICIFKIEESKGRVDD